ncbi:AAA family ATPase [Ottowia thiooxydans]|uniref:AAA family ATPase n=1 Tax=Ottowia thiooxydans TaxID=219182 RepID=UPI00042A74D9|nr:AAA family ATPase [Ottowia thiooxydans]
MVKLIQARVWKYKSVEDSTLVEISNGITVLVGKNESGKTAFLEALNKARPLNTEKFNHVNDFPRKDFSLYKVEHTAGRFQKVVALTYELDDRLVGTINSEVFGGISVVPKKIQLIRTTDYGNSTTVSFHVDQEAALAALRKQLEGLEHQKEVFEGAQSLEVVLERIDELELPADSKLAQFANQWAQRKAKNNGWGYIDGYIWRSYFNSAIPKFLYFDDYKLLDGKINLQQLQSRLDQGQLDDADETALGLLELAGTTIAELMSDEGYETAKANLEAIGLSITQKVFGFWKQNLDLDVEFDIKSDSKDRPPYNSGPNLYIRIKNRRHGVTVPFDQRSKGFIWFFSFLVWFDAIQSRVGTKDDLVLLLDEPGLNLHALAQADLLAYISELSHTHQIIFSTHSPFMVDSARLEDVRVVEDRPKEGSKVTGDLAGSSDESVFPLQAALGYSIAQNLFIAKRNLLVEGPADLIILQHVSGVLEQVGKAGLIDGVIVPVGGLDKLATFVALLGSNKLKLVVLHDRAAAPHQKLEDLVHQKLIERKRVLDFSMFIEPSPVEADIEDLIPIALYADAFNAAYAKELGGKTLDPACLGKHPRTVERINQWLKTENLTLLKDGGFNHYRVAQALLPRLTAVNLGAMGMETFGKLFVRINSALA